MIAIELRNKHTNHWLSVGLAENVWNGCVRYQWGIWDVNNISWRLPETLILAKLDIALSDDLLVTTNLRINTCIFYSGI